MVIRDDTIETEEEQRRRQRTLDRIERERQRKEQQRQAGLQQTEFEESQTEPVRQQPRFEPTRTPSGPVGREQERQRTRSTSVIARPRAASDRSTQTFLEAELKQKQKEGTLTAGDTRLLNALRGQTGEGSAIDALAVVVPIRAPAFVAQAAGKAVSPVVKKSIAGLAKAKNWSKPFTEQVARGTGKLRTALNELDTRPDIVIPRDPKFLLDDIAVKLAAKEPQAVANLGNGSSTRQILNKIKQEIKDTPLPSGRGVDEALASGIKNVVTKATEPAARQVRISRTLQEYAARGGTDDPIFTKLGKDVVFPQAAQRFATELVDAGVSPAAGGQIIKRISEQIAKTPRLRPVAGATFKAGENVVATATRRGVVILEVAGKPLRPPIVFPWATPSNKPGTTKKGATVVLPEAGEGEFTDRIFIQKDRSGESVRVTQLPTPGEGELAGRQKKAGTRFVEDTAEFTKDPTIKKRVTVTDTPTVIIPDAPPGKTPKRTRTRQPVVTPGEKQQAAPKAETPPAEQPKTPAKPEAQPKSQQKTPLRQRSRVTQRTPQRTPSRAVAGVPDIDFENVSGIPSGRFPREVSWKQGFTQYDLNLRTGEFDTKRVLTPGSPRRTFKVKSTMKEKPKQRTFMIGFEDVTVNAFGIDFKRSRRNKPALRKRRGALA